MAEQVRSLVHLVHYWSNKKAILKTIFKIRPVSRWKDGGADRDRTGGLLVANEALSQLSYSPTCGWNN